MDLVSRSLFRIYNYYERTPHVRVPLFSLPSSLHSIPFSLCLFFSKELINSCPSVWFFTVNKSVFSTEDSSRDLRDTEPY